MSEELIEQIKADLGAIITKPKLSDKHLGKPPFRFLHDIITQVAKATGFGEGLYEGDELKAKAVSSSGKEGKVAFLSKIIKCTEIVIGEKVDVNPNKIAAGKEVEKTQMWLALLAKAATSGADFPAATAKTLGKSGGESKEAEGEAEEAKEGGDDDEAAAAAAAEEEARRAEEKEARRRKKEEKKRREKEKEEARRAAAEEEARAAREMAEKANAERPTGANRSSGTRSSPIPTGPGDEDGGVDLAGCTGEVEVTRDLLSALISKPKLTDKLLSKPPYRFLLDIVLNVKDATGFGDGLYDEDELNPKTNKDGKLNFLDKIVNCTYIYLGLLPDIRTSKVVSGKEPEKTNKWLQHLAVAATRCQNGVSCDSAVDKVRNGDEPSGEQMAPSSSAPAPSKSRAAAAPEEKVNEPSPAEEEAKAETKSEEPVARAPKRNTAMEMPDREYTGGGGDESIAPVRAVGRPKTARKRPPKLKDKTNEESKTDKGGPKNVAGPVGIFLDGEDGMSDSDDDEAGAEGGIAGPGVRAHLGEEGGEKHSKMVQKILDEEKKTSGDSGSKKDSEVKKNKKKEGGGIRMGRIRKAKRDGDGRNTAPPVELGELRAAIQRLCQSTNPLGKCMDYVHDDMETMSKELEQWKAEYRQKCEVLEEEERRSEEELQPLQSRLLDVEEKIRDQIQKIHSVKSRIAKNEVRIAELLRLVVSS